MELAFTIPSTERSRCRLIVSLRIIVIEYKNRKKPSLSSQEIEIMTRKHVTRILSLLMGVLPLILAWRELTSVGVSLDAFVPDTGGVMLCLSSTLGWG